jgi:hypothetical protein
MSQRVQESKSPKSKGFKEVYTGEYNLFLKKHSGYDDEYLIIIMIGDNEVDTQMIVRGDGRVVGSTGCDCTMFFQAISKDMVKNLKKYDLKKMSKNLKQT